MSRDRFRARSFHGTERRNRIFHDLITAIARRTPTDQIREVRFAELLAARGFESSEQDLRRLAAGAPVPITVNIVFSGVISSDFALTSTTRASFQGERKKRDYRFMNSPVGRDGGSLHNDGVFRESTFQIILTTTRIPARVYTHIYICGE